MTAPSYPVHQPRAYWRNPALRSLMLGTGWLCFGAAVAALLAAPHVGALWAWGIGPVAAGLALVVRFILPEPRPAAPRIRPVYLLGDQNLNLITGVRPEGGSARTPHLLDAYRAHTRRADRETRAA